MVIKKIICIVACLQGSTVPAGAQSAFHRADSILTLMKLSLVPFLMVILGAFPQEGIAQVNIPDTIPGKGFFVGQLNLAKHIMDFFVDKRDASNAAKLDSNYIGYYPEKLQFSAGLAQNGGWLAIKDGENTYGMRL